MDFGEFKGLNRFSYARKDDLVEKMCHAFEKALKIEKVGPDDNFYDLGGTSLMALDILVEMELEDLSIIDIFQGASPKKIVSLYRDKIIGKDDLSAEEAERRARLEAHSIPRVQVNVIDFQLFSPMAPMWIFPFLITFGPDADVKRIYDAAKKVMEWHPIFSTIYEFDHDCVLQQRIDTSKMTELTVEHMSDAEFERLKEEPSVPFKILGEPMIRLQMIVTESDVCLLMRVHHVVMDSMSIQIIFNNLARAYAGEELLIDTYYSYLADEDAVSYTAAYKEAYNYYQNNYVGVDWCENIEADKKEYGNIKETVDISKAFSLKKLKAFERDNEISRKSFIEAAVILTMAKLGGKRNILTSFKFNDRVDQRKKTACGLLEKSIPLGVKLDDCENLKDLYENIRRQAAEGIGNCVYDWGILREIPYVNDILSINYEEIFDIGDCALTRMNAHLVPLDSHNKTALHRTMLQIVESREDMSVVFTYMSTVYSQERIKEFIELFQKFSDELIDIEDPQNIKIEELLA